MTDERGHRVIVLPRADFFRFCWGSSGSAIKQWALENDLTDLYFDGVQLTIDDALEKDDS